MADTNPIRDILEATVVCTQNILGDQWKQIPYLEDLEKNNKLCKDRVFGIRPLEANELSGTNKFVTMAQTFELVLVRYKQTLVGSDSETRQLIYDSQGDAFCVYKHLASTGVGTSILVNDLTIAEPEFLDEGKLVVQRATFVIQYRCQL